MWHWFVIVPLGIIFGAAVLNWGFLLLLAAIGLIVGAFVTAYGWLKNHTLVRDILASAGILAIGGLMFALFR